MSAIFYIYSDGLDLGDVALPLRARIESFIAMYGDRVSLVDQRDETEKEEAIPPDWSFGINFIDEELTGTEKKDLLLFFQSLSVEFGKNFILGGQYPDRLPEDLFTVSATEPIDKAIDLLLANEKTG